MDLELGATMDMDESEKKPTVAEIVELALQLSPEDQLKLLDYLDSLDENAKLTKSGPLEERCDSNE
jgi:hypothetical protein